MCKTRKRRGNWKQFREFEIGEIALQKERPEKEMREIVSAKESDCLILSRVAALKENLY